MEKERFEALEKLNDLLEYCKICPLVQGMAQNIAEKYCMANCPYKKEFREVEEVLYRTSRERVIIKVEKEEVELNSREIIKGKITKEMESFMIEKAKQGINVKTIVNEVLATFDTPVKKESIRRRYYLMKKAGEF